MTNNSEVHVILLINYNMKFVPVAIWLNESFKVQKIVALMRPV